jgi:hypothetical protein
MLTALDFLDFLDLLVMGRAFSVEAFAKTTRTTYRELDHIPAVNGGSRRSCKLIPDRTERLEALSRAPYSAEGTGQTMLATPSVMMGGVNAPVSFSGLAPGFVGLYQVNAVVPSGLASGNQPVVIATGSSSSNLALLPIQ